MPASAPVRVMPVAVMVLFSPALASQRHEWAPAVQLRVPHLLAPVELADDDGPVGEYLHEIDAKNAPRAQGVVHGDLKLGYLVPQLVHGRAGD